MEDDNNTASKLMNDDIKEILESLQYNDHIGTNDKRKLRDYITNLQQENERLTQGITLLTNKVIDMTKSKEDYKSRIEKANEFIDENTELEHDGDDYGYMEWINIINMDTMTFINNLSDILNGKE